MKNFYVDDLLKSIGSVDAAIGLIGNVIKMCAAGGFKLTKFLSNNPEVLELIPEEDRRIGVKNQDLLAGKLPEEKALGVLWNTNEDTLGFRITLMEKPLTRRGLLAMLSSVFDPLGLVAPFLLKGRKIIQVLCKGNFKWDDPIPEDIQHQ